MMQYRRLGRTGLDVSVIGLGSAQFRLVPEREAIETLKHAFSLGVNLVHTAPDYEGADDLVARAVAESGKEIIVCHQGYGNPDHLKWLFESACAKFGKKHLELFGIACVDDRELTGENVWGAGGQVEFLRQKKREGRIGSTFCTTHGSPSYIRKLVESDAFDAIMMAYNPLGFHLLSYNQCLKKDDRLIEFVPGNRDILQLAKSHDIGIMLMKPLAGGLLCRGKAFQPHDDLAPGVPWVEAAEILRFILLNHEEVGCVVPGTACVAEAEENATAGHAPLFLTPERRARIISAVDRLRAVTCSRCGLCDELCSKKLPISWLFRDYYINVTRSEIFETLDRLEYHVLHPWEDAACESCTDVTCECANGIDIPGRLIHIHRQMKALREKGLLPLLREAHRIEAGSDPRPFWAKLYRKDFPPFLSRGRVHVFRLAVENMGSRLWQPSDGISLLIKIQGEISQTVNLRGEVPPGEKAYFAFEVRSPSRPGFCSMNFSLLNTLSGSRSEIVDLFTLELEVQ